jgi:hypothetical protein
MNLLSSSLVSQYCSPESSRCDIFLLPAWYSYWAGIQKTFFLRSVDKNYQSSKIGQNSRIFEEIGVGKTRRGMRGNERPPSHAEVRPVAQGRLQSLLFRVTTALRSWRRLPEQDWPQLGFLLQEEQTLEARILLKFAES